MSRVGRGTLGYILGGTPTLQLTRNQPQNNSLSFSLIPSLFAFSLWSTPRAQSVDLRCLLEIHNFTLLGKVEICKVQDAVKVTNEGEIVKIGGQIVDQTEGVMIENQKVFHMPYFEENLLKKFRTLSVINSKLIKVSYVEISSLKYLEYFDVSRNVIEYIPGSLFRFNLVIKVAIFNGNNIKAINTDAFGSLQYLGLQNLSCYSGTAENKAKISEAVKDIKTKCLNYPGDCFDAKFTKINFINEKIKTLTDKYDQILDDVRTIKILTSIILTFLLLAALIFLLYYFQTKISETISLIRDKINSREEDSEIIIEETSSINYASCAHVNETFSESTNNLEASAIYDSVYAESAAVEDEKAKVAGIRSITPNSTNYASVEEILTHLDQELAKIDIKTTEKRLGWEKSKLFEPEGNQESHKLGSQCTNAMFEHESLCQANANQNQSNFGQISADLIKSEQITSNSPQKLTIPDQLPSISANSDLTTHAVSNLYVKLPNTSILGKGASNFEHRSIISPDYDLQSSILISSGQNYDQKSSNQEDDSQTSSHPDQNSQNNQNSSVTDEKPQKAGYKTKIPQSMHPKTLNLANIDEKITHFEQTSPVFADVAQKLMSSSSGSQKPANHFGFRSLTYADVAQKIGGEFI